MSSVISVHLMLFLSLNQFWRLINQSMEVLVNRTKQIISASLPLQLCKS